jgi:hypothetical protein
MEALNIFIIDHPLLPKTFILSPGRFIKPNCALQDQYVFVRRRRSVPAMRLERPSAALIHGGGGTGCKCTKERFPVAVGPTTVIDGQAAEIGE